MNPVYLDLHIHTSPDPDSLNTNYDLPLLLEHINKHTDGAPFLISITDHNTINEQVYLNAVDLGINLVVGVELHIKNYISAPAYHCHIYFKLSQITKEILKEINKKLDELYPKKVVDKMDKSIPKIEEIINTFDAYDFLLLPHGGQSHCTFDTSIPAGIKFDTTLERSIYYNQFDGFTARGNNGLEKTQDYFRKLGINDFVNLVTCTDNYHPKDYPNAKNKDPHTWVPTWMLAQPTFDGLRLSLSESSRLIYSVNKPKLWSERIRGVRLKKDNIDIDIKFTQGLNVVIGGSSSGKTLLVDSIYRNICQDFEKCHYMHFEVDKCEIDNPSGITPHYLSQNYIMSVVNESSDDRIDNIEIIKNVFPGDKQVSDKIDYSLRMLKKQLKDLINCVKCIQAEENKLKKIPVVSRLVMRKGIEGNIFENLVPTTKERNSIEYHEQKHTEDVEFLDQIETLLASSPFIKHDRTLVPKIKKELETVLEASVLSDLVRGIITSAKNKLSAALREINKEEQTKQQHFEEMLESVRLYAKHTRNFQKVLKTISEYSVKFDSEKIESMGHKLYIENSFELNKQIFLDVLNKYIKSEHKIAAFRDIAPNRLFESCFKKQNPKVHSYDDFEKRIYKDIEELNQKTYKIITNDNRKFETLSAGWKTSVILDLILGYDKDIAPVIIDQPEDNLATNYINSGLVSAIKKIKNLKQIILVSHNATIPMLADAQNVVLCTNHNNKIIIRSSPLEGAIDGRPVLDHIAEITDGGKASIKKRVKKYNLKNFKE